MMISTSSKVTMIVRVVKNMIRMTMIMSIKAIIEKADHILKMNKNRYCKSMNGRSFTPIRHGMMRYIIVLKFIILS